MRAVILLFCLAGLTTALLEALPCEMKYWWNVYRAERAILQPSQRKIAKDCKHMHGAKNQNYDTAILQLGLPFSTCTFDEFVRHIGTQNSFGRWVDKNPAVFNYDPLDALEQLRQMRAAGAIPPRIRASDLFDSPEFPIDLHNVKQFDMARLNELMADQLELCRTTAANDPNLNPIKKQLLQDLVEDSAANLKTVNMVRNSDQSRWKLIWIPQNSPYGPGKRYALVTRTKRVTYPDGSTPPVSTDPKDKHLETWEEVDWDKTYAQGGKSQLAREFRKANLRVMRTYGKWDDKEMEILPGDSEAVKTIKKGRETCKIHIRIIEQNGKNIKRHEGSPAPFCSRRRRSIDDQTCDEIPEEFPDHPF